MIIVVANRGYRPYIWRHIAPKLAEDGYPVFVPDLPGYANSPDPTQSHAQDKLSTGTTLLMSLSQHLSLLGSPANLPVDVILVTHDRGSRIGHRLAVSKPMRDKFRIKGLVIMDIVPTAEQFKGMGRVEVAKGYFHWALLANVEIATKLITSMGGSLWVEHAVERMTKKEDTKLATKVYARQYDNEAVVRSSCRDYEAATLVDVPAQLEDQAAGRKVDIPMLVFWSEAGLGSWFDVEKLWRLWAQDGTHLEFCPVGDGAGHYLVEDAPETIGKRLLQWLNRIDGLN